MVFFHSKGHYWAFPGGPVVKTLCFQCRGAGSIPGQGTKLIKKKKGMKNYLAELVELVGI